MDSNFLFRATEKSSVVSGLIAKRRELAGIIDQLRSTDYLGMGQYAQLMLRFAQTRRWRELDSNF